ncbi:MAG: hypothetical protein H7Y89_06725 [Steroidobacteraceae bacterium]|nr:hypothetical protein [Steroidobacteraceae bacterium]
MEFLLAIGIWCALAWLVVRRGSIDALIRGLVGAVVATLVNSGVHAAGVPMLAMLLIVGPFVEESSRIAAARKDRDWSLAYALTFAAGFTGFELFVKLTRRLSGQSWDDVMRIVAAGTRGVVLHILCTLILAYTINRSRDRLRSWPIAAGLALTLPLHSYFNHLVNASSTSAFFAARPGTGSAWPWIAFILVMAASLIALSPHRVGWKWR